MDQSAEQRVPRHLHGRILFQPALTCAQLHALFDEGAQLKSTPLTQEFTYQDFQANYPGTAVSLFLINKNGRLDIFAADGEVVPKAGDTLISLVAEPELQPIFKGNGAERERVTFME